MYTHAANDPPFDLLDHIWLCVILVNMCMHASIPFVLLVLNLPIDMMAFVCFITAAKDLVKSMLCVDTSERCTARKVLDDPWFTVS